MMCTLEQTCDVQSSVFLLFLYQFFRMCFLELSLYRVRSSKRMYSVLLKYLLYLRAVTDVFWCTSDEERPYFNVLRSHEITKSSVSVHLFWRTEFIIIFYYKLRLYKFLLRTVMKRTYINAINKQKKQFFIYRRPGHYVRKEDNVV
uniref:Uncharacterized protein n=1 Tax=Rhipicephalus appendiculatus TaxID=34631 RepID=A0A131YD39_RHIAP